MFLSALKVKVGRHFLREVRYCNATLNNLSIYLYTHTHTYIYIYFYSLTNLYYMNTVER